MIVADTNLLAYLFLPGEHTLVAERVFEQDPEWLAPILWRSELRNVLAHYIRRDQLTLQQAVEIFHTAEFAVAGREFTVETARVLDLVEHSTCSAYDCEFVALAQDVGARLVTADGRVRKDFPDVAISPDEFVA